MWKIFFEQFDGLYPDYADMGWRGEYWGKMMRGACFTYRYTKKPELYKVLETAVIGLVANLEKSQRLSTYSPEDEFTSWYMWCRKYLDFATHIINCGGATKQNAFELAYKKDLSIRMIMH